MPHPTPTQIKLAILDAFDAEDAERKKQGRDPLPVAAFRAVKEGIAKANKEADRAS